MADITQAFGFIRNQFFNISSLLFNNLMVTLGGYTVSWGAMIVTAILTSFVLSVFLKGAKK